MSYRAMALVAASVLFVSIVSLVTVTLTTDVALAAITVNGTKSNTYRAINVSDPAAVAACTKGGGTVGKDPKGKDACVTPKKK
jgi:hypothetical protein